MQPLEGSFLVTKQGLIFEVKGVLHPEDRVIAYLRYVPSERGERIAPNRERYSKIQSLRRRERYLKENFPEYLWYDESRGRWLQAVRKEDISYVLEAPESLRELRDRGRHTTLLESDSLALVEGIVESAGIGWDRVGITGSQLLGLSTPASDIDIVVYGCKTGRQVYSTMNSFFSQGAIERYSGQRLYEHVNFRWGELDLDPRKLARVEEQKALQGIFRTREFYIKLVKLPSDLEQTYGDCVYRPVGTQKALCKIRDDSSSIFTPCEYLVDCESDPSIERIVSYRGRFAEQANRDTLVEVRGVVEHVVELDTGRKYSQFVLGGGVRDYMIPVLQNDS
ncbi:hypothetical protein EU519_00270 [Candidatus Thorarchaeota archaeon]|nr:MAG: hypothetical protein EU519_00270 [Candidatus Thorarchaeota archaeon]